MVFTSLSKVTLLTRAHHLTNPFKGDGTGTPTSGSTSPATGSAAASPAPQRRLQRVEILKIAEGTPLIDPAEVVVVDERRRRRHRHRQRHVGQVSQGLQHHEVGPRRRAFEPDPGKLSRHE